MSTAPSPKKSDKKSRDQDIIVIKKYANRRLYNTATSQYITLETLAEMVRDGVEFTVVDVKTNKDLTRAVLAQIIFEQESQGNPMLPISFLRQLIGYYGDNMQTLLSRYLDASMESFMSNQERLQQYFTPISTMGNLEDMTKQNLQLLQNMFTPFTGQVAEGSDPPPPQQLNDLEQQLNTLQKQVKDLQQAATPKK